jgi:hypothetical protein
LLGSLAIHVTPALALGWIYQVNGSSPNGPDFPVAPQEGFDDPS